MADFFGFTLGQVLLIIGSLIVIGALIWLEFGGPRAYCLNCGASTRAPKPDQSIFCPTCGEPIFGENLQRQRQQQLQPAAATQPTVQIIQPAQSPQVKEVYRETVREVVVKIRCQHCGMLFEERLNRCPHCGSP
jgi:Zn finger protein HypA/HybF involved in hydrogenase expression